MKIEPGEKEKGIVIVIVIGILALGVIIGYLICFMTGAKYRFETIYETEEVSIVKEQQECEENGGRFEVEQRYSGKVFMDCIYSITN